VPAEEPTTRQLQAIEGVIDDTVPSRPPAEVLEQVRAAAERYEQMRSQRRELHFTHDDTTNRVVVEVRDLEGNVLRTVPPSKALEIIAGGPFD
jgi:flagellar protein FlaG